MRQKISFIIPVPQTVTINGITSCGDVRSFYTIDTLASEISKAAGFDVPIIEGTLADAPADGFLLVYNAWPASAFAQLGPRIVLLDADRGQLFGGRRDALVTDTLHLAGAVEAHSLFLWVSSPTDGPGGLLGLKPVAERAGMEVGMGCRVSDYAVLSCHGHCRNLATLLVHYLTVYEEMGLHLRK